MAVQYNERTHDETTGDHAFVHPESVGRYRWNLKNSHFVGEPVIAAPDDGRYILDIDRFTEASP